MPRMIDLIRASAVPSNIVQSAAKGSLSIPAAEMAEILVYLATENSVFCEQARLTLAGWDEKSSLSLASDPHTAKEVLDYMVAPENFRPVLLPALMANTAIPEASLSRLMPLVSRSDIDSILNGPHRESRTILEALAANPNLSGIQAEHIRSILSPPEASASSSPAPAASGEDEVLGEEITAYLAQHEAEIAGEDKPFQPIGGM